MSIFFKNSMVADLSVNAWIKLRPYIRYILAQIKTCRNLKDENNLYKFRSITIHPTNICNARCVFCIYPTLKPKVKHMKLDKFKYILSEYDKINAPKNLNLTPGSPPAEPFCDPDIFDKIKYAVDIGYKVGIVSNGIKLIENHRRLVTSGLSMFGISLHSLDVDEYQQIAGVDKFNDVLDGIKLLLEWNKYANEPLPIRIIWRNGKKPSEFLNHPNFIKYIKPYLSKKVGIVFTTWWDDWLEGVDENSMKDVGIKTSGIMKYNLPCMGSLTFSVNSEDDNIRICGCRYSPKLINDLVVGNLQEGFKNAQINASIIINGFWKNRRPVTCQNCGAYCPA